MEELIFDRTIQDIKNKTQKGYYNFNDLNRIEEWSEFIEDTLNIYKYWIDIERRISRWTMIDLPTKNEIDRIRNNVINLKQRYIPNYNSLPEIQYKNTMNYNDANAIEKYLYEINKFIKNMEAGFRYCGTFNCSDVEGLE